MRKALSSLLALLMVTAVAGASLLTVSAEPISGQTSATVTVSDAGEFDVRFCASTFTFGTATVTSSTGQHMQSSVKLCYTDTTSYRDGFALWLSASDFDSVTPGVDASISKDNLYIYRTHMPQRMSQPFLMPADMPTLPPGVGTIYASSPIETRLPMGSSDGVTANPVRFWNPRYSYSLAAPQLVNEADKGIGTSVGVEGSLATIESTVRIDIFVPPGTPAGKYEGEVTLDLTWGNP